MSANPPGKPTPPPTKEKKDTLVAWLTLLVALGALFGSVYNYFIDHSSKTETNGVSRAGLIKDLIPSLIDESKPRAKLMAFEAIVSSLPQSSARTTQLSQSTSEQSASGQIAAKEKTTSPDLGDTGPAYAFLQTLWLTESESPVKCYFASRLRNLQILRSDTASSVSDCGTYSYVISSNRGPGPSASSAASAVAVIPSVPANITPPFAVQPVEKHSGMFPSGAGKEFSAPYTLCSDPLPDPVHTKIDSSEFYLQGDRTCGAWSTCSPQKKTPEQVCWSFTMQGHDERSNSIGYSEGVLRYRVVAK